jgi:hypothetical protein
MSFPASTNTLRIHGSISLKTRKTFRAPEICWWRRLTVTAIISSFVVGTCLSQRMDQAKFLFIPLLVLGKASSIGAATTTFTPWSSLRNSISGYYRRGNQSPLSRSSNSSRAHNIVGLSGGGTNALNESVACLFVASSVRSSVSSTYAKTAAVTTTKKASLSAVSRDSSRRIPNTEVAAATTKFPSMEDATTRKNAHEDATHVSATSTRPMKVLFLSSDTGGGHRASAESLAKQVSCIYFVTSYS